MPLAGIPWKVEALSGIPALQSNPDVTGIEYTARRIARTRHTGFGFASEDFLC